TETRLRVGIEQPREREAHGGTGRVRGRRHFEGHRAEPHLLERPRGPGDRLQNAPRPPARGRPRTPRRPARSPGSPGPPLPRTAWVLAQVAGEMARGGRRARSRDRDVARGRIASRGLLPYAG